MKDAVLLSGGLDSAVVLSLYVQANGATPLCLSFDYGQRHKVELQYAAEQARSVGADHKVIRIDPAVTRGSSLTGSGQVPKKGAKGDVPSTFVRGRNALFITHAVAMGADSVYIGANVVDYSGYPDCRGPFLESIATALSLAVDESERQTPTLTAYKNHRRIRVHAPLLNQSKKYIVELANELGVDVGLTLSCYDPTETGPCGLCDACRIRAEGFREAEVTDCWKKL